MNREREKDSNEGLSADEHDNGSQKTESETESDSSSDSSDSSDSDYECTACNKKFSGAVPLRQHQKGSKHIKKVLARKKKERKLSNKGGEEEEEDGDGRGQIVPEPYGVCKTCDKEFSGLEPYRMHLKSKAHKQRVRHNSILEEAKEEDGEINVNKLRDLYLGKKAAASDVPGDSAGRLASSSKAEEDYLEDHDRESYECKDCGKTFGGLVPFAQHLTSKTHARQVRKKSLLGKITSEDGSVLQSDAGALTVEDNVLVCKVCSASFSGPESGLDHLKGQKHAKKLEKYLRKLEKRKIKADPPKEPGSDLTGNEGVEASGGKGDEPPSTFPYKSTPV